MKRLSILVTAFCFLVAGCQTDDGSSSSPTQPGRGALAIQVQPNPIVAHRVSGDQYDFPFAIALREVGGVTVDIDRVAMDVRAFGGIKLYSESLDRAKIAAKGFPTRVQAGEEIRYQLNPRKDVPSDMLFGSVYADLFVEGTDATGQSVKAETRVTVERK